MHGGAWRHDVTIDRAGGGIGEPLEGELLAPDAVRPTAWFLQQAIRALRDLGQVGDSDSLLLEPPADATAAGDGDVFFSLVAPLSFARRTHPRFRHDAYIVAAVRDVARADAPQPRCTKGAQTVTYGRFAWLAAGGASGRT